jgi:hypothetical protein
MSYANTVNPDERRAASNNHKTPYLPLEPRMHAYRPTTPRLALGFAAVVLTVATIGLSVIAPARMDFRSQEIPVIALSDGTSQAIVDTSGPAPVVDSIDVRASRESHFVTVVEARRAQDRRRG